MRAAVAIAVVVGSGLAVTAAADSARPIDIVQVVPRRTTGPTAAPLAADTHTLYINRCRGGCTVTEGSTDSRSDRSDLAEGAAHLSEFNGGQQTWDDMMSCLRDVYARFNIIVTDIDPGNTPHLEVMVAGTAGQLSSQFPANVGGISITACSAVGSCDNFIPNALAFTFGNTGFYANKPNELCATTAQEIAHTWALDHTIDPTDPMTYNLSFDGIRQYKDNVPCGSDCNAAGRGPSPFNVPCTGTGVTGTHTCFGGDATQNEVQTITSLFGSSGPTPTVSITTPTSGTAIDAMFPIGVACTASDGIAIVQVSVDNRAAGTKTEPPFTFTAPPLANGPHRIEAFCGATGGGGATAQLDVIQGTPCDTAADCTATELCYRGACVSGPDEAGGLGATCSVGSDCLGEACSSDGSESHCTLPCEVGQSQCPPGFGCLEAGNAGVCWPGADEGGSAFCNGSGAGGATLFGLMFGCAILLRGRRTR